LRTVSLIGGVFLFDINGLADLLISHREGKHPGFIYFFVNFSNYFNLLEF